MSLGKYFTHAMTLLAAASCGVALGQNAIPMQSIYNAYWSTAEGFHAIAQLHNNSAKEPLTVLPRMYNPGGDSIQLDPVTLAPLGNASVDIGAELIAKGWRQATTGSSVFQYPGKIPGFLGVEVYEGNVDKSLSFTIPSAERPLTSGIQDAVFWLPSGNAEIYMSLQNTSNKPIRVTPSASLNGAQAFMPSILLAPNGSSVIHISRSLFAASAWVKNAVGGITLINDGPPGVLNSGAWIEDDDMGFSTTLTFGTPTVKATTLIGTQILVGAAGLAFGLPADFVISSQLVLRNISDQPSDVRGTLTFTDNFGGMASAQLPSMHLAAGQVTGVDLSRLKAQAGVPLQFVSASIKLEYSGTSGAVMGRVFGISTDGSYGLYWALQPSAGSSYSESFWTTRGNWTPIITIGNFADSADHITIVMTSNQGTYTLPVLNLKPLESRTINVRELLAIAHPFPAGTDFGGFRITGTSPSSKFVVKEHLIDPVARLATPFYGGYQYVVKLFFYATTQDFDNGGNFTYTVAIGTSLYLQLGEQLSGESGYHAVGGPDGSLYGSNNTSKATLSYSSGVFTLTGVAAGTTGIWASIWGVIDSTGDQSDIATNNTDVDVECAVPTNFHQTVGEDSGGGTLHFRYVWDSSTGKLSDLLACSVREYVSYPGGNPYNYPSPPFPAGNPQTNPDTPSFNASYGLGDDNHSTPGTFMTPFSVGLTTNTVTQAYQYLCPCSNGGNPVQLYPAIPGIINIVRTVNASTTTAGTYTITKSGVSSNKSVP